MRTRELLRKIDRTLDRMDEHMARGNEHMARGNEHMARGNEHMARGNEHMARGNELMARGNELMDQIREEHRLNREQYERLLRESLRQEQRSQAAFARHAGVVRELLLQRQEDRVFLERIEQGIHAQTQGLLHVLDELRNGRGGPGAAPAA